MNLLNLLTLLMVALCSATISFTITTTSMFTWFREMVASWGVHKLEELVFCPWCFSHYVTLVILLTSNVIGINIFNNNIANFLFTWFTIQAVIGLLHYVLLRAYEPVAKAMGNRALNKLREAKEKEKEK